MGNKTLRYYITFSYDATDDIYYITFKDLPEAITQAVRKVDILPNAMDCLEEAVCNQIESNLPLPDPSPGGKDQPFVEVSVKTSIRLRSGGIV